MRNIIHAICAFLILSVIPFYSHGEDRPLRDTIIHHDLKVVLYPKEHRFTVKDTITLPEKFPREFRFFLHKGIEPLSLSDGVSIIRKAVIHEDADAESFSVKIRPGTKTLILKYGGSIHHPVKEYGKEQARGFSRTRGIISEEGVYLAGSSLWYPQIDNNSDTGMVTFNLHVELPPGWDAVSQGERPLHIRDKDITRVQWKSPEYQDEIFLIAAPFTEYSKPAGHIAAMVFLRSPDKTLADKYLDATARYIEMYEKLIGSYPYKKFALVENFWETGFGMPSFTLLGPTVIRLPFIINSSYPHEILHNWWGNSVFPDYDRGNWSEGLTAYLSDHLIREQQGNGAEYRQATLQKYVDYVLNSRDFPLTDFRSRHSSSSEAIGYGKSLMFFHMLRIKLGDKVFTAGLQNFYRENKFRLASFDSLRKSLEGISGENLKSEFDRWISKAGAPELQLRKVKIKPEKNGYTLTAVIEQSQTEDAYPLRLPVAVTMEGQAHAFQTTVEMNQKQLEFKLHLPSRPLRIDIDPEFDIFRRLGRDEIPPAISQALGAEKMLIILPSSADHAMLDAYREFAAGLKNSGPDAVEILLDKDVKKIPSDRAVVVLDRGNRFAGETLAATASYDMTAKQNIIRMGKTEMRMENHSVVLTARNPENKNHALMFISAHPVEALPGLGRKLPHYHKYSYLGFEGIEPANIAKGRWPVVNSPMTAFLPDRDNNISKVEMGKLKAREPLAALPFVFSPERLMETIQFMSGSQPTAAADFIANKFREAGIKPAGDHEGSYFQTWEDYPEKHSDEPEQEQKQKIIMKNVIGVIPGTNPEFTGQSVVVGAHYDHVAASPGADDNASGVAVLIELANILGKNLNPGRSIVFAAFDGEESGKKGSKRYTANMKRYPINKTLGMLNIDTVGRLGKNKLLVIGAGSASEWPHIFRGAGFVTGVEIETVSADLDSSDQKSFEEAGIPAVQLFSGPHPDYHKQADTADKIDADGLLKVTAVAKEAIEYLAKRKEPLTSRINMDNYVPDAKKERKASIGTIPDFSFSGAGCRISGTVPGSPAETCGLREGDIIIRINGNAISSLKDLSDMLKTLAPGSRISIKLLRDGKEMTVETIVTAR